MKENIKFKQSKDGGLDVPINWIIENADFAFTHLHHNGERPHVVTKLKWKDTNWNRFEIDSYSDGIRVSAASEYNGQYNIKERTSKNIDEFIWDRIYGYEHGGSKGIALYYSIRSFGRFIFRLWESDVAQIIGMGFVIYYGYDFIKWLFH